MDALILQEAIIHATIAAIVVGGAGGVIAFLIHYLDPDTRRARRNARRQSTSRARRRARLGLPLNPNRKG